MSWKGFGALCVAALAAPFGALAAGTLTVAQQQDPGSWDPIDTYLVNWSMVANNVFEGLVQRTEKLEIKPALATSWEMIDNDSKIRFKLRQGVKFHNGEPFNAAAVKFTFERLLGAEGAKGPQQSNYNAIDKVDVIDDYTVDLVLKRPDPVLVTKLAGYGGMIVPPKYIQEKGDAVFNTEPVGTGPFKMVEYKPKVGVTLAANPDYWGGAPKLDKVVHRFIAEPTTQVAELQAGTVDIIYPVPISMIATIEKAPNIAVVSVPGPSVVDMMFNVKNGVTKDVRVRKAIIMAVDREAIVKQILQGQAAVTASFQGPLSFGYDPALKPLPFDPAAARNLLKEAGVKPGTEVQFDIRGADAVFREVAQAVAGYLSGVGLKVSLKPYETNTMVNDIIPNGRTGEAYQMAWGGWTFDFDNTAYLMYHTGEHWNPYVSDPKLDQMLEAQRATYDSAKRLELLRGVAKYVADNALDMPMYALNTIFGVNKRVKNFAPPADTRYRFTEVTVE